MELLSRLEKLEFFERVILCVSGEDGEGRCLFEDSLAPLYRKLESVIEME